MSLFHLLFGFSGRANRGKFWLAVVLWIIFWAIAVPVCVLAAIIILGLHLPDSSLPHDELIARYVSLAFDYLGLLIVFIAFTVVSWISAFAVGVKRLHDRDKSGWWILLFYLAPSVLGSIANTSEQPLVGFVLGVGSFVISIWALVELGFLRGTVGPNRYGPDPLQPHRHRFRCSRISRSLRLDCALVGTVPAARDRAHGPAGSTRPRVIRARRDCEISARVCPAPRRSRHSPCCRCR